MSKEISLASKMNFLWKIDDFEGTTVHTNCLKTSIISIICISSKKESTQDSKTKHNV